MKEWEDALTDEFLTTLTEAARRCGWSIDHENTYSFVEWCHDIAGKDLPNLEPYDMGDE